MRVLLFIVISIFSTPALFADNYQKAWEALAKNDRKAAREFLEKALNEPEHAADAALTLVVLETFDGNVNESSDAWQKALTTLKDPYPYYFPLWFHEALAGDYGQKNNRQEKMLEKLIDDPNCPGIYKAAAQYSLGHHYLSESKFKDMRAAWNSTSNVTQWQFAGPFDNLAGSGFDKNYGPIAHPEPVAVFKSTYDADIQWFKPETYVIEGWIPTIYYVRYSSGVVFAQTFVTAPSDMDAVLALGFTGNIRVWVNDQLLISEQEYLKTEYDVFKTKCHLQKGNNRVLVQIGFEDQEYPNFNLRFIDERSNMIPGLTSSAVYTPYTKGTAKKEPMIPFFPETFFEQKIKSEPENLLNYILLAKTYLRSDKNQEANSVILKALEKAPDNSLLHMEYISILSKMDNRTELTRELQHIKENDPYCAASYEIRFQENMKSEQYDAAEKEASEYERNYGLDENLYEDYIKLYVAQEKVKEAVTTIQDASEAYPNNAFFNEMMHNIALRLRKDPQGANRINEQFLKRNFGIPTARQLIQEYFEMGQNDRAVRMLLDLSEQFPGNVIYLEQLYNYYYSKKDNKKAGQYIAMLLAQAPFHAAYHEYAAQLNEQSGNNNSALTSFQKALKYNPNDFDVRRRIRELENRTNLNTLLPQNDPYELIKKSKLQDKSREFDWYYILDERATILYPEGCSETYYTVVLKVLNEKGIDDWKEATLGYNQYRQRLIVEKAEVVKPGGSKFTAEQNGNELVFTNLEKGDAVYLRYRIVSYAYGRMAREFWDTYAFNAFVPTEISRYVLLCPKNLDFDIKTVQTELKPVTREADDFKIYTWETLNEPAMKEESLMPPRIDICRSLSVSTIHEWKEIADWYSDLSTLQSKQDHEVQQAVKNLFPEGKTFSPEEKARRIYEYIVKNIRYSSVSFRQSAFMPQKASSVLQTKLGDCKDLSTLYAAMAREAGLEANLVLLNTRDNGEESLNLPSVDFNHCIIKVKAGNQVWHLELTDSNLPFGSLPNGDIGGLALEIPFNGTGAATGIFKLSPKNRTTDYRHQQVQIDIKNRDLSILTHATLSGAITRNLRDDYANLSREKQLEEMQRLVGKRFSNPVTLKDVSFGALDQLQDTLQYHMLYNVRNEIIEIGELKTFRVPFYYTFIKPDVFQEETRSFPINYGEYEDADDYLEDITVNLPQGKQLSDIPKDLILGFGGIEYSLTYKKLSATSLQIIRRIKVNRNNIPASEYTAFRTFVDEVVNAENRYVAYK